MINNILRFLPPASIARESFLKRSLSTRFIFDKKSVKLNQASRAKLNACPELEVFCNQLIVSVVSMSDNILMVKHNSATRNEIWWVLDEW